MHDCEPFLSRHVRAGRNRKGKLYFLAWPNGLPVPRRENRQTGPAQKMFPYRNPGAAARYRKFDHRITVGEQFDKAGRRPRRQKDVAEASVRLAFFSQGSRTRALRNETTRLTAE